MTNTPPVAPEKALNKCNRCGHVEPMNRANWAARLNAHAVLVHGAASGDAPRSQEDTDDLYRAALILVILHKGPYVSLLQRKLRIGFARASRLITMLEQDSILSAPNSLGRRELLVAPLSASRPAEDEGLRALIQKWRKIAKADSEHGLQHALNARESREYFGCINAAYTYQACADELEALLSSRERAKDGDK